MSIALSTRAGADTVLIYGSTDEETAHRAAAGVAEQVHAMQEDTG